MRVLADTNLFISYLLSRGDNASAIQTFFSALAEGQFTLIVPEALLREILDVVTRKPYLQKAISTDQVVRLINLIEAISISIPEIEESIPRICRDPKDDYLSAYALIGDADYLVTGDRDLLSLENIGTVTIVSPSDFAAIFGQGSRHVYNL